MVGVTGIGSGIDINGIVTALVNSERAPKEAQLNRLEKATTSRISALGTMRSVISEFNTTLQSLNKLSAFQKQTVSSSNSSILTATAGADVPAGKFSLQVEQLASSSKVALQSVTGGSAATFNSGTLAISAGSSSINVNITEDNNSLLGVRDAINTAGSAQGISASIVTDASGSRLVLSSSKPGVGNDLQVVATEDGLTSGANSLKALGFSAGSSVAQLPVVAGGALATFKEGTLNISSGATNLAVAITAEDSLEDIRQKINTDGAGQGISATIETVEGGGSRLLIQSSNAESIAVTATTDDLSAGDNSLSLLASVDGSNSKTIDTAQSAMFKVDGLSVVKDSNTITDVIEGVTIKLTSAQSADDIAANKTVDINIAEDKGSVRTNLQRFVEAYNKLVQTSSELTAVVQVGEGKPPVTGALLGDTSVRNLLSGMRKELVQLGSQFDVQSLAELGITTQKDGKLSIDSATLDTALTEKYDKIAEFVAGENGLMGRLEAVVKPYLGSEGVLQQREKGLQTTISSIDKQREALNLRIEKVQERLYAQYNAMDMLVGRLQKTSESLASQLASLPGFVKKDK
ncbi:flagellar filament capping protein FliD [Pseudomonas xionganensis]|uniref:Flagellar hook-associated protein 2 n=1 Tax=Pseudomonas xionganensis TaxID=2654845 RepID=A0A6I4KX30_9PSED|nr:flagellar filament capping protein FliD [Pseudomonas xionganensis]MVW76271.1 flagellar filament capping protein FliD [Pseudomonas xionganensis]